MTKQTGRANRQEFSIAVKGPFSLEESATFGFGQRLDGKWDGVMRLAFCVDGYHDQVGVEVRQDGATVNCVMHGSGDLAAVRRQVARVLWTGLNAEKVERLHGVARAALDGRLDVDLIRASDPDAAMADLRSIKGIGPFYSALIVIRGSGLADVLPLNEPKMLALTGQVYGLPGPPSEAELRAMAEAWRPFRTWAAVLIRAAGPRVLD